MHILYRHTIYAYINSLILFSSAETLTQCQFSLKIHGTLLKFGKNPEPFYCWVDGVQFFQSYFN